MKWPNVKLIFARELRDQLRDRRTLFTVAIMPMILYPLMGMAMLQVGQFMREHPSTVWVVGEDNFPETPRFIADGKIDSDYAVGNEQSLLQLRFSAADDLEFASTIEHFRSHPELKRAPAIIDQLIQKEMAERGVDVAVFVPTPIKIPIGAKGSRAELRPANLPLEESGGAILPAIYVFNNSASDKSRIGSDRFNKCLNRWRNSFVRSTLEQNDVSLSLVQGIQVAHSDVADKVGKQAAAWSKILPFIIMIWSLTGAFYPAIDLCAGEKERGTFETLLSSPAQRSEIAIGKLLTVMSFSMATSVLNLLSMGFTGMFVAAKLGAAGGALPVGAPPLASIGWLLLALIPISALFSAIALAAAAFARSSKEGQYYLVPLMMISMPLMMIPMLPAAQLDFGTSLIPVSGLMLLLRGLIEGQYAECAKFAGPVCVVTLACCWFSVRWVVNQFNSEAVLFRASERFGVGVWLAHIMRERVALPSFGNAVLCGVVILVAKFFIGFVAQTPTNFSEFAFQTVIILVATIAVPAIIMALVLTKSPRKSLRLNLCSLPVASAAILTAIFLNPLITWITGLVMLVYPPGGDIVMLERAVSNILGSAPGMWAIILVFALAPAIIEELAFRGFILSGFESLRNKWQAIFLTSLLFGVAHGMIQQTVITFFVGMILGVIAVQTKSIIPCMLFHLTHNSIAVLLSSANSTVVESSTILSRVLWTGDGQNYQYGIVPGILMTAIGVLLVIWFLRLDVTAATVGHDRRKLARFLPKLAEKA